MDKLDNVAMAVAIKFGCTKAPFPRVINRQYWQHMCNDLAGFAYTRAFVCKWFRVFEYLHSWMTGHEH